jgi:hypothetical protein
MKKNYYSKVITDPHFKPLSDFTCAWAVTDGQIELSKKLASDYHLPEDKFLHLIQYVEFAFLPEKDSKTWQQAFEDTIRMLDEDNTEKVFTVKLEYENKFSEITKDGDTIKVRNWRIPYKGKKIFLEQSIKKIATEMLKELTHKDKISVWKSLCIIGFIFAFYQIGINYNFPIQIEAEYKISHPDGNYLQYLSGNIKRYIIT